jgi:hypothetical protein
MSEHLFPPIDRDALDSWATTYTADIAEHLVDEIAEAGHSWPVVAALAGRLTEVANRLTWPSAKTEPAE